MYTHIGAVLGQRSVRLLADLLSVHLGRAAVVLGVGVVSGAAMLTEEGRLQGRGRRNVIDSRDTDVYRLNFIIIIIIIVSFWALRSILTYGIGVASDLHTSELKPVPVGVQLSGSAGRRWHQVTNYCHQKVPD